MDKYTVSITRRADNLLNGLEKEFESLYSKREFHSKIDQLEGKKRKNRLSEIPTIKSELFRMFDAVGIQYEKNGNPQYYRQLVEESDAIPDVINEDVFLQAVNKVYQGYASPEDYMKRIVDRLCNLEDGWQADTLRLRILKQFIKYGDYLKAAGCGGKLQIEKYVKEKTGKKKVSEEEVLNALDDKIFSLLDEANKEQRKFDGKYGLLKVADDLAAGNFRAGGATKKNLYLFAMVYNMTYASGNVISDEIHDTDVGGLTTNRRKPSMMESDIEKNLFQDYYANNIVRFLKEGAYSNEYELDPSGQGINYKNFAEIIYLYYISKDDLSPQEKIVSSSEMIKRVKGQQKENGQPTVKAEEVKTGKYKEFVLPGTMFTDSILNFTEADFEKFICENYDCSGEKGDINANIDQKTAFEEYKLIIEDLEEFHKKYNYDFNYGLEFVDTDAYKEYGEELDDQEIDEELIQLLINLDKFMKPQDGEKLPKALMVDSSENITRTSMLVAYYYEYNFLNEGPGNKNFAEVFNDFKEQIDTPFMNSSYQPLSGKNLIDVLIVFSSYACLNL